MTPQTIERLLIDLEVKRLLALQNGIYPVKAQDTLWYAVVEQAKARGADLWAVMEGVGKKFEGEIAE